MSDQQNYVPIFKLMQGEREALEKLDVAQRKRVTPLFEIRPPKSKPLKDKKRTKRLETMEEVLNKVGANLAKALPDGRAFIDGIHLTAAQKMASGEHPLAHVLEEARKAGVVLVPVTGPERSPEYQEIVKAAVGGDKRGVCVRLRKTELFEDDLDEQISAVLRAVGASPASTDLVLDMGQIENDEVSMLSKSIIGVLGSIEGVKAFRTLTLASGAFPQSISHINLPSKVARADWLLWQSITKKAKAVARLPTYGDYAIQGSLPPTPEAAMRPGSPNIRYTANDYWLVVRGGGFKQHGYNQYYGLAEYVREHECYAGRTFSWGDEYIFGCAGGSESTGNPATWRKVGTSHHIAQVLKQLTSPRVT